MTDIKDDTKEQNNVLDGAEISLFRGAVIANETQNEALRRMVMGDLGLFVMADVIRGGYPKEALLAATRIEGRTNAIDTGRGCELIMGACSKLESAIRTGNLSDLTEHDLALGLAFERGHIDLEGLKSCGPKIKLKQLETGTRRALKTATDPESKAKYLGFLKTLDGLKPERIELTKKPAIIK